MLAQDPVPVSATHAPAHAAYPDVWHRASGGWQAFHAHWWGSCGAARLQEAQSSGSLRIEQDDVCGVLDFLDQTSGIVCILPRLTAAYASILNSHKTGVDGVVYTGQPGSGRSFLLFFLLLARMAAAEVFYYTNSQGITYRFDETGVAEAPADKLIRFDIMSAKPLLWSLVDSNAEGSMPPFPVTMPALFKVHMSGVEKSEYKWTSRTLHGREERLLDPWSSAELLACLPLRRDLRSLPGSLREAYTTELAISAVVAQSGPYVCDVAAEILHPGRAAAEIAKHLQSLTTVQALFILLRDTLWDGRPIFNALFVRRRDPRGAHITEFDAFLIEFKSKLASSCFIAHMRHLGIEVIKAALAKSSVGPRTFLGQWTEHLFAVEECKDDDVWQASVGIMDIPPLW